MNKVPVGVLISGSGTNLQALLDACAAPDFPARVAVVISNRKNAFGLQRAREAGVEAVWLPHRAHPTREDYDRALLACLQEHHVRWVAMAGFMRIVTPVLIDGMHGRVLNIHPALLPAFPGLDGQGQAFDYGATLAGATVHLVDEGVDHGPIVLQAAVPVFQDDDRDALQRRILGAEHVIFPTALRWAVQDRIQVDGRKARIDLLPGEPRFLFVC
jgi:phosphoribosylglycinamide formyltransferase-1